MRGSGLRSPRPPIRRSRRTARARAAVRRRPVRRSSAQLFVSAAVRSPASRMLLDRARHLRPRAEADEPIMPMSRARVEREAGRGRLGFERVVRTRPSSARPARARPTRRSRCCVRISARTVPGSRPLPWSYASNASNGEGNTTPPRSKITASISRWSPRHGSIEHAGIEDAGGVDRRAWRRAARPRTARGAGGRTSAGDRARPRGGA